MFAKALVAPLLLFAATVPLAYSQASSDAHQQVDQHSRLYHQYLAQHRPELAIPELEKVVAIDPRDVDAQANLGVLLYFSGDFAKAEPHLHAALALNPSIPKLQALLGLCERRTGELDAARKDMRAALSGLQDPKVRRQVGLELVEIDTARDDLADAAIVVNQLKAVLPTDPEVLYAAYRVYTDLANESLLDLSVAAPDSGQMHQAMAHELVREHDNDGVIKNLQTALKADPNLPGAHYELAQALQNSSQPGQKAEAEQEYQLALAQNPNDDKALTALGDLLAAKGDHTAAIARYKQALALQPEDADASIGLAHELVEAGQPEEALIPLQSVEKADPTNILAHYRLSAVYRRLRRPEDAKREVAEYERLKGMKEKLRSVYEGMRMNAPQGTDVKE